MVGIESLKRAVAPELTTPNAELTNHTINAASFETITKTAQRSYGVLVVAVQAIYNAAATAGVRVRWLYSPDSINFDSIEDAEAQGQYYDLSFTAGQTKQATILIPVFSPVIAVQIVNQDSNYPVTVNVWSWYMR